jgi:excisionase family DNA binding protein
MTTVAIIPGYYTLSEAAGVIGVSYAQVTRYVKEKQLPCVDLGHQKLIEQSAVHTFKRRPVGNPAFQKQRPAKKS